MVNQACILPSAQLRRNVRTFPFQMSVLLVIKYLLTLQFVFHFKKGVILNELYQFRNWINVNSNCLLPSIICQFESMIGCQVLWFFVIGLRVRCFQL